MKTTELKVEYVPIDKIKPYENNAKLHPSWQIDQIVNSIRKFGNCDPIGVWTNENGELEIVEGHGRLSALKKIGEKSAPVIFLDHLNDEQRRAYALVHNQTTMNTDWEFEKLAKELDNFPSIQMDSFGFDTPPTINWDEVEEINEDNYEKPESTKLRCPMCGGTDESIRFVKVSE